jgi:hypothetical protein
VLTRNVLGDLRAGLRRGRFRYESEAAALDLVLGTTLAGMRTVLEGRARPGHDEGVARVILRGLGLDARAVERAATMTLPARRGT